MTESPDTSARTRFVINLVGVIGLLFGVLPIVRYLLDLSLFEFTVAPYEWLELEGAARFIPPGMVLVVCIVVAYVLEQRLSRD
jgi:NADH:ubiquinone oxidoreductase subunit 5 (subunit L)/multisubunit Na+/H+ antiporter MnhA subunit